MGTWNVEGLTDAKLEHLQLVMSDRRLHILCIQETHLPGADSYVTDSGFLVILSGGPSGCREYAGVGFVVSPWARRNVISFSEHSDRIAWLRLRVQGGKVPIVCAYAPQGGRDFVSRQSFFYELGSVVNKCSSHGPKIILGDLNARLHHQRTGEENIIGPYAFGNREAQEDPLANRSLLLEFCELWSMCVANSFFPQPPEKLVTYFDLGASPASEVNHRNFAQLDLLLLPQSWRWCVDYCGSEKSIGFSSHHFLVEAHLLMTVERNPPSSSAGTVDLNALQSCEIRRRFVNALTSRLPTLASQTSVDEASRGINNAFAAAARETLPSRSAVPRRPWISAHTLGLIDLRTLARASNNYEEEKAIGAEIKASAAKDRAAWLDTLAASGSWQDLRKLRGGRSVTKGRLRNQEGEVVASDAKAETLASYFSKVQWAVRPVGPLPEGACLGPNLPVNVGNITLFEVRKAAKKLRSGRAAGPDNIPGDFWRAVLNDPGGAAVEWILDFCQTLWTRKVVPADWHLSRVVALFKKGDIGDCANYRPISLIAVGYKLYAHILLQRLKDGGAEMRIWHTQYGFKAGCGTADALLLARRLLENSSQLKDGQMLMLALDWAKAFDSIAPDRLAWALHRFGIPQDFVEAVKSIYVDRQFFVRASGVDSAWHPQASGIVQGCPLSPFLFSMAMTCLITDADRALHDEYGPPSMPGLVSRTILYADDTLLVESSAEVTQRFMDLVRAGGHAYGLKLNDSKVEVLNVGRDAVLLTASGAAVKRKTAMVYLGSVLSADGRVKAELGRRLALAQRVFDDLSRVWRHTRISQSTKLKIYSTCVLSTLMYSLHTAWLREAEKKRLDGFHCRCLRKLAGIPHAFHSRITNAEVLHATNSKPLRAHLLAHQLQLYGHIARKHPDDPARKATLKDGSIQPRGQEGKRRRGRPRHQWNTEVYREAVRAAGSELKLEELISTKHTWKHCVTQYALR